MPATKQDVEVQQFLQAAVNAIIRAETDGRLPSRFTDAGKPVWATFRNELTSADLVALAIQDAGAMMPMPFEPARWWPGWPDWAMLQQPPADVEQMIHIATVQSQRPQDDYLRAQAEVLKVRLPSKKGLASLPAPQRHERWLELPGTGGWLAYTLCMRPDSGLYLWENFTIVCGTPQEMLLAGLIAWELGAPPRIKLPIRLDDADLTNTLKSGETYHAVMGRRDLHHQRDLGALHPNQKDPFWV